MRLARRLATDWPRIGQLASPWSIPPRFLGNNRPILKHRNHLRYSLINIRFTQHQARPGKNGDWLRTRACTRFPGADQRRLRVVLLGQSPFLHRLHSSLRKQGDLLRLRCLTPFFRRSFCQENCACSLCSLINNATSFA